MERQFSPNDGIVEKNAIANITGVDLYESMIRIGTMEYINETNAILDPNYSKNTLFN